MGRVIGIDLGTTNTVVAVLDDGRPRVLEDSKGYKVLPSTVWLGDDGEVIVGHAAKSLVLTDPTRTAYAVKRLLGRHFDSDEVKDARRKVGYDIAATPDGTCMVQMEHGHVTAVELSAHVLRTAKEMAERTLDEEVDEAVITVPAYFNHAQRAATLEAAALAGLRCERLLNEPTASALAYGFRREIERTLLVFDLGGGTFDVSVLRLSSGVYEILATLGDSYLGGEDFDYRIVDHLAEAFLVEHGVDLREDRTSAHRLKDAAERAKCELSFVDTTTVLIPQVGAGANLEHELDRMTLEGLVEEYVERALSVTRQALADAGLQVPAIDEVILVGGQTRMPRIREAIGTMFDKEPSRSVHPEEVVAIGAAVHAASLTDETVPPTVLIDVTPFDLGIDVAGGMFQPIIQRNSTIPASAARIFATAHAQQASVRITVRQGASRSAAENEFLGEFIMGGLTPAPRMETKVEVNFKIDANGMLHVSAMEPATGKSTEITVRNYGEVAQSKGVVQSRFTGVDAVQRGSEAAAAAPESAGEAKPSRRGRQKKVKEKGGGLLGALFGRVSKTKKVSAAARPKPKQRAAPASDERSEPSIIEAVAAERLAASEPSPAVEPAPAVEQAPEAVPSVEPLFESHSPDAGAGIVLPELDPSEMESLEPELLTEDPFAPVESDAPLMVEVSPAEGDSTEDELVDDVEDDLADLIGEEPEDDLSHLQPPPSMAASDEEELEESEVEESPVELFDEDALGGSLDGLEEPAPEALAMDEDDLSDLIGEADDDPFAESGAGAGPPEGFMGVDLGDAEDEDLDPEAPAGGRVDFDTTMFDFARIPADESAPPPDAPSGFDDDLTEQLRGSSPKAEPEPAPAQPRRKPAKLKLSYKRPAAVVREYRANLSRGGCFVRTTKPLSLEREVSIEVRVAGLDEPLTIPGIVTWSSVNSTELEPGQEEGMGIEYQIDAGEVARITAVLDRLEG